MQYLDVYNASVALGGATTLITIRTAISLSFWLLFLGGLLECQDVVVRGGAYLVLKAALVLLLSSGMRWVTRRMWVRIP